MNVHTSYADSFSRECVRCHTSQVDSALKPVGKSSFACIDEVRCVLGHWAGGGVMKRVYRIPSASHPGHTHRVTVINGVVRACECKGWTYRGWCRHADLVRLVLFEQREHDAGASARFPL